MNHLDVLLKQQHAAEFRLAEAQAALGEARERLDAAQAHAADATLDPEQRRAVEAELTQAEQSLAEAQLTERAAQDAKQAIDAKVEADLAEQAELAAAEGHRPGQASPPRPHTGEALFNHVRQGEFPEFPNAPAPDHPDTRNTVDLMSCLDPRPDDYRQVAEGIVQTAHQPDGRSVYVGELQPGEKLYAFTNAVEGEALGNKSDHSPYYASEAQVRAMAEHGLIDFAGKTINAEGIRDYLGLPEGNRVECLVEAEAAVRTPYVETRIGSVDWHRETEFATGESHADVNRRQGGGYQIHPDLDALGQGRADPKTLPIATLDGKTWDFRDFREENRPLTAAQCEAIAADYEQRRDAVLEWDSRLKGIEGLTREQAELKTQIQDKLLETQDYAHPEVRALRQDATRIDQALKQQRGEWAERCVGQPDLYPPLDDAMRKDVERQQQREAQSRAALEEHQNRQGTEDERRAEERARLERELERARQEVFADRRGMGVGM